MHFHIYEQEKMPTIVGILKLRAGKTSYSADLSTEFFITWGPGFPTSTLHHLSRGTTLYQNYCIIISVPTVVVCITTRIANPATLITLCWASDTAAQAEETTGRSKTGRVGINIAKLTSHLKSFGDGCGRAMVLGSSQCLLFR